MEKPAFGVVLGVNRGVPAFCNSGKGEDKFGDSIVNGHKTGIKYQCVEYARRWLLLVKGLTFRNVMCACDIWDLDHLVNVDSDQRVRLVRVPNGSNVFPQVGALLIYKRRFFTPFGHIAVITHVDASKNVVGICEQNFDDVMWNGDYARELRVEYIRGRFFLRDTHALYGWMVYEDIPENIEENSKCCII